MNQQELETAREALSIAQIHVWSVATGLSVAQWETTLPAGRCGELLTLGHFEQNEAELGWTPRQVVGHLRDSALVFTSRIRALQGGGHPVLADFVPDEPARLRDYATRSRSQLLGELSAAQLLLRETLSGVDASQLDHHGTHEVDGELTLADVVGFLPGHQRDHAEQLARF